jgi:predicted negative regulator of RcsB-dependent stress response
VDDYLSEREQWEWVKAQVRENGPAVVLAVALAVGAVFGWRWWQGHLDTRRLEAGARYMQMVQSLERGDRSQALVSLGELEREYADSPYADQARLLAARVYVDGGQLDKAAEELAAVAAHSKDRELAQLARLRLARVQISQGKADSALATLGNEADASAFAGRYHEARGDAYFAKGDRRAALSEYRSAQAAGSAADGSLLELKIADLGTDTPAAAAAAAGSGSGAPIVRSGSAVGAPPSKSTPPPAGR